MNKQERQRLVKELAGIKSQKEIAELTGSSVRTIRRDCDELGIKLEMSTSGRSSEEVKVVIASSVRSDVFIKTSKINYYMVSKRDGTDIGVLSETQLSEDLELPINTIARIKERLRTMTEYSERGYTFKLDIGSKADNGVDTISSLKRELIALRERVAMTEEKLENNRIY